MSEKYKDREQDIKRGLPQGPRALWELVEDVITQLFKDFLDIIVQVGEDEDGAIIKTGKMIPDIPERDQILRVLDGLKVLDDNKYKQIRRRVLSAGNDAIRDIMNEVRSDFRVTYSPRTEIILSRDSRRSQDNGRGR